MRSWCKAGTAAGLVLGVLALCAVPAGATIYERGTYSEDFEETFVDCGITIHEVGHVDGRYRLREGKGKTAGAFFGHDRFTLETTLTNTANDEFVTLRAHAIFNEIKATRISGTIFEFEAVEAGVPFSMYDSDGTLVARDRGSIHHHAIFDVEDDDVPGAIHIEELDPEVHGPHPGFDDFCGLLLDQIG